MPPHGMEPEAANDGLAAPYDALPEIAILGAAVSPRILETLKLVDPQPQVQTYHLQWAVIHALESATGVGLKVFSTVPTRDFPYSRKAFWACSRESIRGQDGRATDLVVMPFVSVLGLKQVTRFLSCLAWVGRWAMRRRRKILLLYGLMISHLVAAIVLRMVFGVKVVAIVTDPPTPDQGDEGLVYRLARKLDRSLLRFSMRQLDGVIPLARPLAKRYAPHVASCVIEGMISDDVVSYCRSIVSPPVLKPSSQSRLVVMYAGTLNERYYGVELLLEVFDILKDRGVEFWVFGRGRLEGEVKAAAAKYSCVTYFGLQPSSVVLARMEEADIMINPRPEVHDVTPYSFPSKLIECMALGKVVIGGRLSGIPDEYHPLFISLPEVTARSLASAIEEVMRWPPQRRAEMGRRAKEFVWQHKTQQEQGRKMTGFLYSVAGGV